MSYWKDKRVLVTGGASFIGSHVVDRLVKLGAKIRVADDLFTPKSLNFDLSKPVGVFSRAADLTRTRSVLNWEPNTSFQQGLQRTMAWYYETKNMEDVSSKMGLLFTER